MEVRSIKLIVCLLLIVVSNLCSASDRLVFVNKSFDRDLKVSLRLYESFEKFVRSVPAFYIVLPKKDKAIFLEAFKAAEKEHKIKNLPIFLEEEKVFEKCGSQISKKVKNMDGWKQQQVVKLCFSKTGIADNYFTIDSDTYFTRPFDTEFLFYKGKAKTYAPDFIKKNNRAENIKKPVYKEMTIINEFFTGKSQHYNNFVMGFEMWSSEMLRKLEEFVYRKQRYDFADLINLVPLEMQWYAMFIYEKHPNEFYPLLNMFSLIDKYNAEQDKRRCIPTAGDYGKYGISYQKSEADDKYTNPCGGFNTRVKFLIRQIRSSLRTMRVKLLELL